MAMSAHVFEAGFRYPTKGWLRSTGKPTTGNADAERVAPQDEACGLWASRDARPDCPMAGGLSRPLLRNWE